MFVRGGYVYPGNYLSRAGSNGYDWSSVGRNNSSAYSLGFNSGNVNPSSSGSQFFGFSLRCVALGG